MPGETKRVAQIGNSHALAITQALVGFRSEKVTMTSFPPFDDWHLFASARLGAKIATNAGGVPIMLSDFDIYIVSAAGWWASRNEHLATNRAGHPLASVRCAHWGTPNAAAPKYIQIVSRAVFDHMVYTWIAGHRMAQLTRFLALEAGKTVIWVSWPLPSRSLLTNPEWLLNVWYGAQAAVVWRAYREAEQLAVRRLTAEYGDNVTLLPPPRSEIADDGFLDEDLADPDPFHANVRYGAQVVEQLAALLA